MHEFIHLILTTAQGAMYHFTDEELSISGQVDCPKSHSEELGFKSCSTTIRHSLGA